MNERNDLMRCAGALLALAGAYERATGISQTTAISHYGVSWQELMVWLGRDIPQEQPDSAKDG